MRPSTRCPAANGFPTLKQVLASKGFTPKSFAAAAGEPDQAIEASHESGIYYVEGAVSGYGFTLGAFYATQAEGRVEHNFLSTEAGLRFVPRVRFVPQIHPRRRPRERVAGRDVLSCHQQ